MKILFTKQADDVILPSKREGDGCFDIYPYFEEEYIAIQPHETRLIPTGLRSTFPPDYRISIRERGSNTKSGLIIMAGQIDSNYTGEWFIAAHNGGVLPLEVTKNVGYVERNQDFIRVPYSKAIAQFAVEFSPQVEVVEVDAATIDEVITERGAGCLGSSGK